MFDRIFSTAHFLSQHLQDRKVNLSKAVDLICATLETFREDKEWEHLRDYAIGVANSRNIDVGIDSQTRRRQPPRRLDNVVVMETIGHREQSTEIDHFKVTVYYPVLDLFIAEVKRRFSNKNLSY